MKYTYIFTAIAILFATSAWGQKVLNTESGQRILLVEDGSWRIISETESINGDLSEAGTSLNAFKSPKQGKYPITADQREAIQNLLTNFLSDEAQLMVNIEMAKRKLDQLKNEKSEAKKDKDKTDKLKDQIAQTKANINSDEVFYSHTSDLIKISNDLLDGKVKNREKAYASLISKDNAIESVNSGMGGVSEGKREEKESSYEMSEQPTASNKYPSTFSLELEATEKDDSDCEIVFDGYDSSLGSERKEVKTQPFFSFSQEKMKPYFKTEDYLTCEANLSKVAKSYYLTLNIRIRSKDAGKSYGMLKSNENLKIQFINGRSIYGQSINDDEGQIESYTGHTLYTGIYELEKADISDLKKNYLDKIGIIWSSGYEEYDIYNVDFLTNQVKCLNK